jgi:hypothetical protein
MNDIKRICGVVVIALGLAGCSGGGGQTMECTRYLACVQAVGGSAASLDSTYGPNGTCWEDTAEADKCTVKCKAALAAFPSDAGC